MYQCTDEAAPFEIKLKRWQRRFSLLATLVSYWVTGHVLKSSARRYQRLSKMKNTIMITKE